MRVPSGVHIGAASSKRAITDSDVGVEGTKSLFSGVPGGRVCAGGFKIYKPMFPSSSLATNSKSTKLPVHNGLLIRPPLPTDHQYHFLLILSGRRHGE